MSPEENKTILLHALDEIWNKGNLNIADELAHPNLLIVHTNTLGIANGSSIEQMKQSVAMYRNAFPDLHATFGNVIAEGEEIAVRFTISGAHHGALLGIPPTGNAVEVTNITIYRMPEGKIVEQWGVTDSLGLLRQLGIGPTLAANG